ncbi:DUF2971 domain-containing protein [Bosea sp. NPDC003192]|uniref:DUF2971 domain-containing protein n=1 Tax=Bosea sp. NPDC003192 TaxID=3390551 RepID=UPI003CFE98C7
MWRGYGANGDGAAIVFNTENLPRDQESPLIIAPVAYATRERRREMLKELADRFAEIISNHKIITKHEFINAVFYLFDRLKLFSIYTKHSGFSEEQEWRVVYMPDRDTINKFKDKRHYITNGRGVEPKLRLTFGTGESGLHPDLKLDDLIHEIILGPSHASVLAERSIKRMIELLGRETLIPKVRASTIPYRKP